MLGLELDNIFDLFSFSFFWLKKVFPLNQKKELYKKQSIILEVNKKEKESEWYADEECVWPPTHLNSSIWPYNYNYNKG